MRYFVLSSEHEAQAVVDMIDARGRECYIQAGYTVRDDGAIIAQADGQDDPVGVTSTWDVPRQRKDGKWVVAHIEAHPMASYVVEDKTVLEYVLSGLDWPLEDQSDGWWPLTADLAN
jgi:hypothetical protein